MASTCEGCGRKIEWATDPDGKKIPLDAIAPCYDVTIPDSGIVTCKRNKLAMVSHFVTCPKRDDFRRKSETID